MLSIGKLSPGRADYYLDTVAKGAEEYYLGSGEAPGRWIGHGAELLGLDRPSRRRRPEARPRRPGPHWRVAARPAGTGTDARLRLHVQRTEVGHPPVRSRFRGDPSARRAPHMTLRSMPRSLCSRPRHAGSAEARGGAQVLPGDGFVAAAFRHRTSRSGDPHLHTHVVVANLARSADDGRWTALDGRQLYAWCRTAGFLYEAHLRAELTGRLGVEWGPVRNGIADVAGIPRRVIEHFSQRRQQITERMAEVGSLGGHAAQVAAYATRQAKDTTVPYAALKSWWASRAAKIGLDDSTLTAVCDRTARQHPTRDDIDVDHLYRTPGRTRRTDRAPGDIRPSRRHPPGLCRAPRRRRHQRRPRTRR